MTDLRQLAKGQPCTVRLFPVCDGGGPTTVLAHFPLAGLSGMRIKSPDLIAAFACCPCHDVVDGRVPMPELSKTEIENAHAKGCFRTQVMLLQEGVISVV